MQRTSQRKLQHILLCPTAQNPLSFFFADTQKAPHKKNKRVFQRSQNSQAHTSIIIPIIIQLKIIFLLLAPQSTQPQQKSKG